MLRLVPPAGTPLRISQIVLALAGRGAANRHSDQALATLRARLQVENIVLVSSGRAALWLILRALRRLAPDRDVVALPAYICFSVPASIVRAGLRMVPVDIDPHTLDMDSSRLEALPAERLLCVIAANLFGLPSDLNHIRGVAKARDAFVVDNAAQGLGAIANGQPIGTSGDVGLYSLGRGKALTTLEGGIAVTNSPEIAGALRAEACELKEPSFVDDAGACLQMLAYAALLNPRLYWIPASLPFLKLGVTEFDPGFRVARLSALRKSLLARVVSGLDAVNRRRREHARVLAQGLAGCKRFAIPQATLDSDGIFIRFPVLAADEATRQSALEKLRAAGIGASSFYPTAICDIPGISPHMARGDFHCLNAEDLSRRLLTLPTHPHVQRRDIEKMISILQGIRTP